MLGGSQGHRGDPRRDRAEAVDAADDGAGGRGAEDADRCGGDGVAPLDGRSLCQKCARPSDTVGLEIHRAARPLGVRILRPPPL